ncbi:bromodomain-containing protein 8-like isoform X2 [Physella acuta]|uniref:bromodomain-containing protein 8-like isoform X2 n=1 Tax=Physella acuta TaxID=109671 RepID=UPI0027DCB6A5|nr:bromodomain-containing protein 8-like isoform X2 [Physella acuta]
METPVTPTNTNPRLKPKKPLDVWSVREKLCLASAVFKIGDQNWVSVSRSIKPYVEPHRPPDWFHQRNCLLQYFDMMEQLEQPKRKRGGDRSETDTPSLQIMRKMTIERSEQLKKEMLEMQQEFKTLKAEVEAIKAGEWDDKIKEVWEKIQEDMRAKEEKVNTEIKVEMPEEEEDELKVAAGEESDVVVPTPEIDDSTQDSVEDISVLTDEESMQISSTEVVTSTPTVPASGSTVELPSKMAAVSHLLSSLLKSDVKTATGLQQLKIEQEQGQLQQAQSIQQTLITQKSLLKTPVTQDDPLQTPPSSTAPTLSRLLSTAKGQSVICSVLKPMVSSSESETSHLIDAGIFELEDGSKTLDDIIVPDNIDDVVTDMLVNSEQQDSILQDEALEVIAHTTEEEVVTSVVVEDLIEDQLEQEFKEELENSQTAPQVEEVVAVKEEVQKVEYEEEEIAIKKQVESAASETELTESSIKDESPSPTSSISSRLSEAGSKKGRGRGRPRSVKPPRIATRKIFCNTEEDKKDDVASVRHSDIDESEDDIRSDDLLPGQLASVNPSSIMSESFPNSPASLSICSDTEEEKSLKQWKKSIMLVWRAAATHKYANVFLHPVTDEIAPGYRSVVLRPMDLSTIKKNIETGMIRTTVEFQRDMMLMFTNAIMYNSSNHNVYKMAKEMYDDVMQHIEMMIQTTDSKNLRQSRRTDTSDKEDENKKRRLSIDQSESGGQTKKRKARLDESIS